MCGPSRRAVDNDSVMRQNFVTGNGFHAMSNKLGIAIEMGHKWKEQDANLRKAECRNQIRHVAMQVVNLLDGRRNLAD